MPAAASLQILDLGRRPYQDTWELQKRLVIERADGRRPDTLVLVEHDPVYTRGTSCAVRAGNLGAPVFDVERGGDMTYHGPGQLVGYPILNLKELGMRVGDLLRLNETVLIETLKDFGIAGEALKGKTGVWTQGRKIASIGIAVRGWVSYHGFSLNVDMPLAPFERIRPCGFDPAVMTTLARESGRPASIHAVKQTLTDVWTRKLPS